MNHTTRPRAPRTAPAALIAVLLFTSSVLALSGPTAASAASSTTLIGTFELTPGSCAGDTVSGTYLRMILPSGGPTGPYLSNSDSRCHDQSFTELNPGTDGGLISGSYQPQPSPPFDAKGNALAGAITAPAQFYGTSFATSANRVDPQTHLSVGTPTVTATGTTLRADLRGFAVTWNGQYFNQGAPKPDGSYPGNTRAVTGTYDPSTGAFTLSWTSQVQGGPFDKFTGQWHLQGVFHASGVAVHGAPSKHASAVGAPAGGATTAAVSGAKSASTATLSSGASTSAVPTSGATRSPAAGPSAGTSASPVSLSTSTRVRTTWHVAGWLLAVLIVIAVIGFGAIWGLNRSPKPGASA